MNDARVRSGPARVAVLRWAWRLFRREWRQQVLTLGLLTAVVAGAVWSSAVAVNAGSKPQATLGDAKAMIRLEPNDPATVQADIATIQQRFGPVEVIEHSAASAPGVANHIDVRAQDPHGRYGHPTLALRSGRYPNAAAEVAITETLAHQLGTHIGDPLSLDGVTRTVVGFVENPRNLDDQFALVSPALPNSALTVLLATDRPIDAADTSGGTGSFDVISMGDDNGPIIALTVAAVTASMALVGLVAASGFLVVAHRRQRQLGILAALGASERHLRLVLVAAGALVGVVAAVVGTVVGIGVWLLTAPMVERAAAHRIDRFDLPWPLIALCIVLAIAAAIGAAWWPARSVARVPVMAAISQRPPKPLPVRRSAAFAMLLLLAGIAAIALAKPQNEQVKPWLLIAGLLAVISGTVLVAPSAIRAIAVPARRLPLAPRLALRDLVRYQARAATALAAITLALSIAVATTVVARAADQDQGPGNLSNQQLLVTAGTGQGPFAKTISQSDVTSLDRVVGSLATESDASTVVPLDVAMPVAKGDAPPQPVSAANPIDHGFSFKGVAYVATPELLRRYGIDPSSIDPSTDLLTSEPGIVLFDISTRPDGDTTTPTQQVALPPYSSAPRALITGSAMRRHGWTEQRSGWLLESSHAFTDAELASARRAAAAAGLVVESRDISNESGTLGRIATIAGTLLALAILAMTLGLIRGESAADVRTLTAVGAPSRTRRGVTAAAAGALALAGVVLAAGGAYIAVVAAYRSDLWKLSSPPVVNLLVLAVGLPVLAAAAGWALAGREPAHIGRDPG